MDRSPLVYHILAHQSVLTQIDFWREIFMNPDRMIASTYLESEQRFLITTLSPLYTGKLFVYESLFYAIENYERIDDRRSEEKTYSVTASPTRIAYHNNETRPLATPQDVFQLKAGDIVNYPEGPDLSTTIGIFLANYLFLVYPFEDTIPYINDEFSASKLEKKIAIPLIDGLITTAAVKDKYINALSLFGQANEIFCPNISEKTISIPESIHRLREQLISENREALEAGDASVMSDIEAKLISAYKEHLKGDPAKHFLLKSKYYNVTLKKLFLVQGMVEEFGTPGKYTFIDQPMGKGWKQKDLPTIFNEVRGGSYARGIETADGGVIAKLILRVLQDARITVPDCGTTRGETVTGTKEQLKDFMWNYMVESDGTNVLITDDLITSLIGKTVVIRTPGYCQEQEGYCSKCFGKPFEVLGQRAFAPIANDFAKNQQTRALKKMHGSSIRTVDISDLNQYLLV